MRFKVKNIAFDEDMLYSQKEIKVGKKKLNTPIKSLDLSKIDKKMAFNERVRGINEIYKRLKADTVHGILYDPVKQDRFNWGLNALTNKSTDEEITICLLEYMGEKYPDERTLEFIVDTAYSYSDITPLPLIGDIKKRITDENAFQEYIQFLRNSIEIIETLNSKSLMGIIPPIVAPFIPHLVKFYAENGISAFIFDFDGKTPFSVRQSLRGFTRALNQHELLEQCFVHSININYGRFNKGTAIVGAKDILSFGIGIDCIGERHKPLKAPQEFFEKLQNREENKLRVFNKEDYGYYKLYAVEIEDIYPDDSKVRKELFTGEQIDIKDVQKIFNIEQLGLEAIRLRGIIKNNETKDYISKKQNVKELDLKKMRKIKKDASQTQFL